MRRDGIVIGVVMGSALVGGLAYYFNRPSILFSEERRAIERLLYQWWEGRPPPGVDEDIWRGAWQTAYNGFGNVCFSPKAVSLQEMHRLKADLQAKMHKPATMASLRWFWDRLAETGPSGKEYIKQMTPLMDEALRERAAAPAAAAGP